MTLKKTENIDFIRYEEHTFKPEAGFNLKYGGLLEEVTIRYERYGKLNRNRTNAILIIHALTGDHHAAGKYKPDDAYPGWWDNMIGPGKAFDTNRYQIICSNNLGGCGGTTGPNSLNPKTKRPYGLDFPAISISDMVALQYDLMKHLNIAFFQVIAGASMGGMMALEWSIRYPSCVKNVIAIGTTAAQGAQSIAFSEVGRQAIMSDPAWQQGNYFKDHNSPINTDPLAKGPHRGLAVARMLAHITYLSPLSMKRKFGRRLKNSNQPHFSLDPEFQVESYLQHQGNRFKDRFDANSYLYITKALNYFDLQSGFTSLHEAFMKATANYLFVSFSSDWIYTQEMSFELLRAALAARKQASYFEIISDAGHDAFLLEHESLTELVRAFLNNSPAALSLSHIKAPSPEQQHATQKNTNPTNTSLPPPALPSAKAQGNDAHRSYYNNHTAAPVSDHSLHSPSKTNEFNIIADQINSHDRVLDLGCADGTLLDFLCRTKKIIPYGIEKDHHKVLLAMNRNLYVAQGALEKIIPLYTPNSFDVVILSRTIQQLENPLSVIDQMLTIGKTAIVSFLNQGYFRNRINFLLRGEKFQSTVFPHNWHNNPDIHLLSIHDFESYITEKQYHIKKRIFLKGDWLRKTKLFPNLLAGVAIYVLSNQSA
ncbi:homoserine O-acetyltransferase [Spirochaetota bacterium]|nr:homoserine O-acetyltransferase [Spirochaetota bacterium]